MKTCAKVCGVLLAVLVWACTAQAQYVSEDFTGSTASDWTFVTAAGDGAVLTGNGTLDPEGDGWLRLTSDKTNQNSFVYYNNPIQTSRGLVFTFDFVIWSATSSNADGFALVIFDAEASPVATGGWGGSLGYAQHVNNGGLGLNGGIAAFGFDTFGNFSNPTEGRIGGPGKRANSIAIRGSMGADRTEGYEYVTGVEGLSGFATGSADSRDDAVVHTVRLTITPERLVSIEWKAEGGEWETLLDNYACILTCPSEVKFGFTASTGSVYSNHEIRNFEVNPYTERLPDTGQTKCYDTAGDEINCPQPGDDFYGQDAEYVKTRAYTDLGNGIVRDDVTGLEWVQDGNVMATRDPGFDTDGTSGDGQVTWQHAFDYVDLLNSEEYLGYSDWRLPSIQELASLVDSSRSYPAIDPIFSAVAAYYWSSTADAFNTSGAGYVDFATGFVISCNKTLGRYVRAVRGNPLPANNFIDNNDGTLTDTSTGLMWQQATAPGTYTWQQALDYVALLNVEEYLGYDDWRLPDRNELQSIVDYSRYNLAIDPLFSALASFYWASTTYADSTLYAWSVDFSYGVVYNFLKTNYYYVRAVRSGQYVLLGDVGTLCIEDYHCDEGDVCVDGVCEVEDNAPAIGDGPFLAIGPWPALKRYRSTAFKLELDQNYDVLWTFSDDYGSCVEAPTHRAAYRLDGTTPWRYLKVTSDDAALAWTEVPVDVMIDGTYQFYTAVQDCAGQTDTRTTFFSVASGNELPVDDPPVIIDGPFLAVGPWPVFPIGVSQAFVLNQNYDVYWTFSDDYAICSALSTHLFRYRKMGDEQWSTLPVSTNPEGDWYAYVTLPVESLENGTYEFRMNVRDCAGQWGNSGPKFFKFKVER
jgi:hypothetical protein